MKKTVRFLYRLFCTKGIFYDLAFISIYSVLNALSEHTYFYISKNITSYTFVACFESLQCILNANVTLNLKFFLEVLFHLHGIYKSHIENECDPNLGISVAWKNFQLWKFCTQMKQVNVIPLNTNVSDITTLIMLRNIEKGLTN